MTRRSLRQIVTALVLLVAFVSQGTWALAGTTGGLTGTVVDATSSAPIAGAVVTVTSPSQTATATTDASGRFGFLTLAPDTYTVSVTKDQFQPTSSTGQIVFADTVQSLTVRLQKALTTIAKVTANGSGLVKSGTTADVYSINAASQAAAASLGGGGSLNSAYSAIATVPGAYVPQNQTGYYQTVHIRGGDYDQVGYEFDGVPVNRSFDNYPSSSASSLGNAEVQVYTGATPADSEGQGLAGYINQVIRTGTYPGFADGQLGIGTPTFYHRAAIEAGGATPDRLFSYYVGVAGYNQAFNYIDNQDGAGYQNWLGTPLAPEGNPAIAGGGYYLGSPVYAALNAITSRDVVVNTHFAIPHKHDGGRDDVQVLWDSEMLFNDYYNSTNDITSNTGCAGVTTGAACANDIGLGQPVYLDGYSYTCQGDVGGTFSGTALAAEGKACTSNYYFPSSSNRTGTFQPIPVTQGDSTWNDQEIVKLQYTHNMGSTAFFRIYGYTYYSDWLQHGPQGSYADYAACCSPDYELSSHTRGISAQFQDQVNSQNLASIQASYVTANSTRDNNTQMFNFTTARQWAAVLVNAGEPYAGTCYNVTGGQARTCYPPGTANAPPTLANSWLNWSQLQAGTVPSTTGLTCNLPGSPNQGCTYLLAENSLYATYNTVQPQFFSSSITDEFRPSDKWLFNLGVRLDNFSFDGSNTNSGPARDFWYNAYNNDNCINHLTGAPYPVNPGAPCNAGDKHAYLQNISQQNFTFPIWQPRVGGTYTVNSDTVVRFSFGRYTQAPNTAFEQYNTLEENIPFQLLGPDFLQYGRNAPGLPISPPTSLNYDVSLEQRLHGTDWSFKLTPFLRQTQDQIQQFFLNQKTGFVSGTNIGSQRSQGIEFQAQKGDFSKNGLAGLLSFAYTNSYVNYGTVNPFGATVLSPINQTISNYNAYTKACAPGGNFYGKSRYGQPLCGTAGSTTGGAAACFKPNPNSTPTNPLPNIPDPSCAAGDVANPYWNLAPQNFLNPSQNFPTYDIIPDGIGSAANAYGAPYVATLLLNYRHDKFAITPSLQFSGGTRYGAPETTPGIDPAAAGCTHLPGTSRYDATTCATNLVIPDQYTGTYDNLGSFVQPNSFGLNLQLSYDVSPRISLTGNLVNIVNGCFGGTKAPWTVSDGNICSYGIVGLGEINPVGNAYNPAGYPKASIIQQFQKYPYQGAFGPYNDDSISVKTPFQFYVSAKIKL